MVMKFLKRLGAVLLLCVVLLGALLLYWRFRPNGSEIHADLDLEHWPAVANEWHNSNTDMIYWKDAFYMVHAQSPYHFASPDCVLVVRRSEDAKTWEELGTVNVPGEDIRDPKFGIFGDELFMYVLKNRDFAAEPYTTALTTTKDGVNWSPLEDMGLEGWLFWRPKSRDGKTWYLPAYWHEHGRSILLTSTDGRKWEEVSEIYAGDRNDETDIEFLPSGRMIATARLEVSDSLFGHPEARTMVGYADPPYTEWHHTDSYVTRFDGPALFAYDGAVYGIGRHNPQKPRWPHYFGSIFGTKRTALYKVEEERLIHLSDLPSAGDTAYAGVVMQGDTLYACYYTNDINYDWPWIMGMVEESDIQMAKIGLKSLKAIAEEKAEQ